MALPQYAQFCPQQPHTCSHLEHEHEEHERHVACPHYEDEARDEHDRGRCPGGERAQLLALFRQEKRHGQKTAEEGGQDS